MSNSSVLLAAGGTGGHLFPAEALAHELKKRGYNIVLTTDARARKFADDFPADEIHVIKSATVGSKNPIAIWKTLSTLYKGYRASKKIITDCNPVAVVGFGGYPTIPPLWAATSRKIPSLVHEQNAVLGRANRLLANRVNGIAIGFSQVGKKPNVPIVETGNPVRPMVDAVKDTQYPTRSADDPLRLVVFGGSQGARFFSEILPPAMALLSEHVREKFSVLQQARPEDKVKLKERYSSIGVEADVAPFFKNLPEEISKANLVIARAGASSVTELAVIGRPSLLVPLPGSLDDDQANNAIAMRNAGGADLVKQSDLSAERLAEFLLKSVEQPEFLSQMGVAAKKTGIPDASSRLADCVECVISGGNIADL